MSYPQDIVDNSVAAVEKPYIYGPWCAGQCSARSIEAYITRSRCGPAQRRGATPSERDTATSSNLPT